MCPHSWPIVYKNHHHRHFIIVIFHYPAGWHWRPKPCPRAVGSALYILRLEIVMLIIIPEAQKGQTHWMEDFDARKLSRQSAEIILHLTSIVFLFMVMATLTKHCDAQSWLETFHTIGTISFRTGRKNSKLTSAFQVFLKVSKLFRLED